MLTLAIRMRSSWRKGEEIEEVNVILYEAFQSFILQISLITSFGHHNCYISSSKQITTWKITLVPALFK